MEDGARDPAPAFPGSHPVPQPDNPPVYIPAIGEDGHLYPVEKIEAHRRGIHHLALSVFVFDGDDLLIQRRAAHKYHSGGQWANTCCTHPKMNENIADAAVRRLGEELGITLDVERKRTVEYAADVGNGLQERERVVMFRAQAKREALEIKPNPEEVSEIRWIDRQTLHHEAAAFPERFTPWFRIYLREFPDLDF